MGGFYCPKCQAVKHITEDDNDPRLDHCWECGTPVPWTEDDIAGFKAQAAEDPELWPGLREDD